MRSRTDASGTTKGDYDKLNRESVRTLQNGAQTALAYTPGGDIDFSTDPTARRITPGTRPAATDFDYNNNDKRTKTVHPGGTTQTVTIDDNGRPQRIQTTSGTQTFVDLSYSYASAGKDTTKIRTRTDNITSYKTTYTYDSQDRLRYALEADGAGTRKASWLYCWGQGRQPHQPGRQQERLLRRHHVHLQRCQ
jgi:YD repeat-containing protein